MPQSAFAKRFSAWLYRPEDPDSLDQVRLPAYSKSYLELIDLPFLVVLELCHVSFELLALFLRFLLDVVGRLKGLLEIEDGLL